MSKLITFFCQCTFEHIVEYSAVLNMAAFFPACFLYISFLLMPGWYRFEHRAHRAFFRNGPRVND